MARRGSTKRPRNNVLSEVSWAELYANDDYDNGMSWQDREELSRSIMIDKNNKAKKFDAITGVYQIADSVLTNSSIQVTHGDFSEMENGSKAPAWSDGKAIYFNTSVLNDINDSTILSLNGINYHEVCHILWTPRAGSDLVKNVIKNGYTQAFNSLEDQRIETLMVSRFPSTREALTKACLSYILEQENGALAYPLIRGRRFLPIAIRQMSADLFTMAFGSQIAQRVADLVDEYRLLNVPSEPKRALEIIGAYSDLLNLTDTSKGNQNQNGEGEQGEGEGSSEGEGSDSDEGKANNGKPMAGHGLCGDRSPLKSGRNESGAKQGAQAERAKNTDTKSDSVQQGIEDKSSTKSDSNSMGTGEAHTQSNTNSMPEAESPKDEFAELVRQSIETIMRSPQAKAEARQIRSAIREVEHDGSGVRQATYDQYEVSGEYRSASSAFGRELEQLMLDNDPAWLRYNPTGKLNVQRAMNMDVNQLNTVFDRWHEGNDNFDIEAVILLDNSGSMSGSIHEANQSVWAIKRALEEIDGRVTVYAFSDDTELLYSNSDRTTAKYRSVFKGGSTNPIEGLLEAERILESSKRKTKLLFTVSDGDWSRHNDCDETIKRINDLEGVTSTAVFIAGAWTYNHMATLAESDRVQLLDQYRHNCHSVSVVTKPTELIGVARNLMRGLSRA